MSRAAVRRLIVRAVRRDRVDRVVSRDQAEVILLRVLGDLSFAQIAWVMDRDVDWVGVTLHRGLKRLASRLGTRVLVKHRVLSPIEP